jgi:hypothetical protein
VDDAYYGMRAAFLADVEAELAERLREHAA